VPDAQQRIEYSVIQRDVQSDVACICAHSIPPNQYVRKQL
jgi:hypothetical protein